MRHLVQTPLHGLDRRLVFPTADAAPLAGVHLAFIAQVPQLLEQYRLSVSPFSTEVKRQISCSPTGAAVGVGFGLIDGVPKIRVAFTAYGQLGESVNARDLRFTDYELDKTSITSR